MIGSLITRGLVLMFGYAYPAYECYKTVEMNKPDVQQLRFWCQYWILVAMLTVCERIGDLFIGWVPMYGEAKLAFFIYLWFPKTKGTAYVYDSFFRPYVAKHETDIDRNLVELRTRAGDMAVMYFQKAASYSQTRVFEILQYIASQSSTARPAQAQQGQGTKVQKPTPSPARTAAPTPSPARTAAPPARTSSTPTQSQDGQQSSPAPSSSSSSEENVSDEPGPSEISKAVSAPAGTLAALIGKSKSSDSADTQAMQGKSESSNASENAQPSSEDTVMEESRRVTRARSKRPVQRQLSK